MTTHSWHGPQVGRSFAFARYLPLFDPDHFSDPRFYEALERIGYRQVLLGGTGSAGLSSLVRAIKARTRLSVVLYPSGPSALGPADLVVLPDVMNAGSSHHRPFGPGPVATACNIARMGLPYLPVAHFIMGSGTAAWYAEARPLPSETVLLATVQYASMVGYRHLALDFETPDARLEAGLARRLKAQSGMHLLVSDTWSPSGARAALEDGVDTVITASDVFEEASDPLALADLYWRTLLAPLYAGHTQPQA